jgi:hypothetical protein
VIVVRNVFQLKFGQAKAAVSLWKEGIETAKRNGHLPKDTRLMTDVVGPSYTLVFETTHESLADWENASQNIMKDSDWRAWYPKFVQLAESSHREIFQIAD